VERGSAKHGARQDDALADELAGSLGRGGSNREEWADPEGPADDDPPTRVDPTPQSADATEGADPGPGDADPAAGAADQDDAEMRRLQHDMAIANDWNPAEP
jgi:hypothetical protein